jgi:hypothetical protein
LYLEFGAGRAGLSLSIAEWLKECPPQKSDSQPSAFLLIDRDRRRNKLDKLFRENFPIMRERIDIADIDLQSYLLTRGDNSQDIKQSYVKKVGVKK